MFPQLFNPDSNFHVKNAARQSSPSPAENPDAPGAGEVFAETFDAVQPHGWLVDLLNHFGACGGFDKLRGLVADDAAGVVAPMYCVRPFGACAKYLTPHCLDTYVGPIHAKVFSSLWGLQGKALHKEALGITSDDGLWSTARALRQLLPRLPRPEGPAPEEEHPVSRLLLQTLLRLLKGESFPGVMGAVGVLKRLMEDAGPPSQWNSDRAWVSSGELVDWILSEDVLKIVFSRDTLDKTQ